MPNPLDVTFILEWSPTTDPLDFTPVWVDITEDFLGAKTKRGRQNLLSRFEAGTATFVLDNTSRAYDPTNTSSTYYPNVKIGKRIRLRATYNAITYPVWEGFIERYEMRAGLETAEVVLTCVDLFKFLSQMKLSTVYVMSVLESGPQGFWRLNETATTQPATDTSGNARHGTYFGGVTLSQPDVITDGVNGAATFDGTGYVIVPNWLPTNPLETNHSFEMWIKHADNGTTARGIFRLGEKFIVYLDSSGRIAFRYPDGAGGFNERVSTITVDDDNWHHVVCDITTAAVTNIYIDGTARNGAVTTGVPAITAGGSTAGVIATSVTSPATSRFLGSIDEVAGYNRTLGATTASGHYAARTAWANELSGARIDHALDQILPAVVSIDFYDFTRDIDAGQTTIVSASDLEGQSVLEHIQKVEESEQGWFYISRDSVATFVDRHAFYEEPRFRDSNATFGDTGAELPFEGLEPSLDDDDVWTIIELSRRDGGKVRVEDPDAQADYAKSTLSKTGLLMNSDTELVDMANDLLNRFKTAKTRLPFIQVNPVADPVNVWPQVLGRELLDRITIKRRPPGGGSTMEVKSHIQGISHQITADPISWKTTFDVFAVHEPEYTLAGIAGRSEAGLTTVAGY